MVKYFRPMGEGKRIRSSFRDKEKRESGSDIRESYAEIIENMKFVCEVSGALQQLLNWLGTVQLFVNLLGVLPLVVVVVLLLRQILFQD